MITRLKQSLNLILKKLSQEHKSSLDYDIPELNTICWKSPAYPTQIHKEIQLFDNDIIKWERYFPRVE
jgi:hypothetical protein